MVAESKRELLDVVEALCTSKVNRQAYGDEQKVEWVFISTDLTDST